MTLVTLADVKVYLGITSSAEDSLLTGMLAAASGGIEQFCGRSFRAVDAEHFYDRAAVRDGLLQLSGDLHMLRGVTNGDGAPLLFSHMQRLPNNAPPTRALKLRVGQYWLFPFEDSQVAVRGVWGYVEQAGVPASATRAYTVADVDGATLNLDLDLMTVVNFTNGNASQTVLGGAAYRLGPSVVPPWRTCTLLPSSGVTWESALHDITVTGTWYPQTYAPPVDVQQACREWVAFMYAAYNQHQQVPPEMPPYLRMFLVAYRRMQ